MTFWSWLKTLMRPMVAGRPSSDPLAGVRWVPAAESPFGVEVLDCRSVAETMIAGTKDPAIAESYVRLRGSAGEEHRGRSPKDATALECNLRYPSKGGSRDGPVFKAEVMEDKWDIYFFDGLLYFARSWTGDLEYRAAITFQADQGNVVCVEARKELFEIEPPYPVAAVDYLIRSHLFRLEIPHPLPSSIGRDPRDLAVFSFMQYGRYGRFGAFGDTTRLQMPAKGLAGTTGV